MGTSQGPAREAEQGGQAAAVPSTGQCLLRLCLLPQWEGRQGAPLMEAVPSFCCLQKRGLGLGWSAQNRAMATVSNDLVP